MNIDTLIEALELDSIDDWEAAHRIAQHWDTPEANWIHAYLHRIFSGTIFSPILQSSSQRTSKAPKYYYT